MTRSAANVVLLEVDAIDDWVSVDEPWQTGLHVTRTLLSTAPTFNACVDMATALINESAETRQMIVWVTRASTPDDPLLARRARITFSTWEDGPFDVVAVSEQAGPLTKVGIARTPVAASHLHATARRAQSLGFLVARSHDARKVLSDLQRFAGGIDQRQIVDAMDAVDAIAGVRYYDDGCTFAAVQFYSRRDTRWTRNFAELARDVRRISRDEVPGFLARRQTPKPVGRAR